MDFKILNINQIDEIAELGYELNPTIDNDIIFERLKEMFQYPNYNCFGMYLGDKLTAIKK